MAGDPQPTIHEHISAQFLKWESRGRGGSFHPVPVEIEPPFEWFPGYKPPPPMVDDGRVPTFFGSLLQKLSRALATEPPKEPPLPEETEEPEPKPFEREEVAEFRLSLPTNAKPDRGTFASFLLSIQAVRFPVAFEILGTHESVTTGLALSPPDAGLVEAQLKAFFPEVAALPWGQTLLPFAESLHRPAILEFGLEKEFAFQLEETKLDPFVGLAGALNHLAPGEAGLYQVIFVPCRKPWGESLVESVENLDGKGLFVNCPELLPAAERKASRPLYAVILRLAACSEKGLDRAWEIVRDMAGALRVFCSVQGNGLVPLKNERYEGEDHLEDLLFRQSRRPGMILTLDELAGFVHLPEQSVKASRFERQSKTTKAAPEVVVNPVGRYLGDNIHRGQVREVRLTPEQRVRHMHLVGASGTGKSTLLFRLIRDDIIAGEGCAVLDPHGDLIDRILSIVPESRIKDVVLVDPSDEEYSVGFNILSAHSDLEKNLLASDLVSVFERLSTSWGDQMGSVLRNAILAFLESSRGGTLSDLRKFLLDPAFRSDFLKTVGDPDIVYYWQKGFAQLTGNKSIGPVLTRLDAFLAPKPIRYMVSQKENRIDMGEIMNTGKIFLAKLSAGAMGKENAYLLGSLLMAKFQQMAMSRQHLAVHSRRPFYLYVDEFQHFISPSMAEILAEARKYRLGLILAHQELRQLERDRDVASAVMSHCHTRVAFRVSDADARTFEGGFATFKGSDIQNLGTGEAIVRVERSDFDFNLVIPNAEAVNEEEARELRGRIVEASRQTYATPRKEVEAQLRSAAEEAPEEKPLAKEKTKKPAPVPVPPPPPVPPPAPPVIAAEPEPVKSPPVAAEPKIPADPGRGGEQHKAIQKRVKIAAQKLGYRVTTEKEVLGGAGSVDLALESPQRTIAVEITITTTIDHELGNVAKCLKADFQTVAVVAASGAKLAQMREAVTAALGPILSARVGYFQPDDFIAHLESLAKTDAPPPPSGPKETVRKGYKVKIKAASLTPEELRAKEEAGFHLIAETMKETKPKGGKG